MMAAEPSIDNTADVSASPDPQPVNDAQDGNLQPPTINGSPAVPEDIANKRITSVEDQINSADVSVSGGSDTEASRAERAEQKDGDRSHGRTSSSTKKPATFKAVSVNKTFLAAKSSSSGLSSKTSDKPAAGSSTPPTGSASLSISRPRLVAKSGTGTGGSSPRFSSVANGKPGVAPDPAAVWNKNRPTPAPEPKKFTDEELKKYGIHMASRLNEEDAQGQNKWADIDDDDEDWAPEAITWGDGTKTTLPHSDEPPPPVPPVDPAISKGVAPQDDKSPAPITILGAQGTASAPKPSGLPSGKGLILKSATQEKPILVAKPPAPPAPAKSPWATLPPVDKAPPVSFESPYASRGPPRDHPSLRTNIPPLSREGGMHDDFNRATWRDRAPVGNRELFNSRSGRYEPVIDRHAPPLRSDSLTRHPALLQRASQMDQPEPSPAFQTSRTAQDIPFGRRRGSSNVSGGSGSFMQRMGKPSEGAIPPPEVFLDARRSSHAGSVEGPISPAVLSAHSQQRPDWATRPSPRAAFAVPHRGPPSVDYHAGPPPPPAAAAAAPPTGPPAGPATGPPVGQPPQLQPPLEDDIQYQKKLMREGVELARKRRQEEEAREEAARRERIQKKLDALGPAPERKSDMKENAVKPTPIQIQQRVSSISAEPSQAPPPKHEDTKKVEPATAPAIPEPPPPSAIPPPQAPRRPSSNGQDLKPPTTWPGSGARPDRFSSWVSGTPRNVWGSPDNSDKALGNGTFNPDLGRVPGAAAQPPHNNATPSPIAPPGAPTGPQGRPQAPSANLGLRSSRFAAPTAPCAPGTSGGDLASKWVAAVAENDKKLSAQRMVERAGRDKQLAERGISMEDAQPAIKDTWRPVHVPGDGTRHAMGTVEVQSHPSGPWKASRDDFPRDPASHLTPEDTTTGSSPGVIGATGGSILSPPGTAQTPQSRPSRFFPAKDLRTDAAQVSGSTRPSSPSPPPPTMEGHPVYEGGDVSHPHVSLPRPHPVVKLPPSMATAQPSQPKVSNVWAARAAIRDGQRIPGQQVQSGRPGAETKPANWQDKINILLNGGKGQLPKHALIDAASKTALDQTLSSDTATTVVLPTVIHIYSWEDVKSPTTKPMAEDCFEEQEMGSLPQIRFPHKAPEAAWQPAVIHNKPLPKKFAVEAMVKEPLNFPADIVGNGNAIVINFQGMTKPKVLTIPFPSSRGGRGGHGRPTPRHRGDRGGSGHAPRGGKRDTSNTYGDSENPRPAGRGGRGGYRVRGSGGGGGGAGAGGAGAGNGGEKGSSGDRGSDTWSRYSSSQKQASMPA